MADFSDYLETQILNWIKGTTFPTAPTNLYVGLFSSDPTDTGSAGTEVTTTIRPAGRVTITFGANTGTGDGGTVITSATDADFGTSAGAATVTHFAIFDAASGGNMLFSDALTSSKTIAISDPVNFPAGNVTITID